MLKYTDTLITFSELPDEVTLCINLSRCPCKCEGCHSSHLAEDIGKILNITVLEKLLDENQGASAVCFMGGDNSPELINHYASLIRETIVEVPEVQFTLPKDVYIPSKNVRLFKGMPITLTKIERNPIKIGWYSGRQELANEIDLRNFDYIKLGPYIKELGPLNNPSTNQRMYKVIHMSTGNSKLIDITHKFWKRNNETQN